MASDTEIRAVQRIIGYEFHKADLLALALTAAGANEDNHEGNRRLAQLGGSVLQLAVLDKAFVEGASRSMAYESLTSVATRESRAKLATALGLNEFIKCCPQQQGQPPSKATLGLTISAIVGALWLDTFQDWGTLLAALQKICLPRPAVLDPSVLLRCESDRVSTEMNSSVDTAVLSSHACSGAEINTVNAVGEALAPTGPEQSDDDFFAPLPELMSAMSTIDEVIGHESASRCPSNLEPEYSPVILDIPHTDGAPPEIRSAVVHADSDLQRVQASDAPPRYSPAKRKDTADLAPSKRPRIAEDQEALLAQHISLEKRKCKVLGRPCPEKFFTSTVQQRVSIWKGEFDKHHFKIFFFAIASPQALALLKDIVQACRLRGPAEWMGPRAGVSGAKRIEEIERLDQTVAYLGLLRRCHVLRLFQDHRSPSQRRPDGFIVATADSLSAPTPPRYGNPLNRAVADSTRAMLQGIYPDLPQDDADEEYRRRYRLMSNLRKLGQRLDSLVSAFGFGILGLLPLPGGDTSPEGSLSVTDKMISSPSDAVFMESLQLLERFQGQLLRELSNAVADVMLGMFSGPFDTSTRFAIDGVERDQILSLPKGAPEILAAFARGQSVPGRECSG